MDWKPIIGSRGSTKEGRCRKWLSLVNPGPTRPDEIALIDCSHIFEVARQRAAMLVSCNPSLSRRILQSAAPVTYANRMLADRLLDQPAVLRFRLPHPGASTACARPLRLTRPLAVKL
jgi:hypothetical protein